MIKKKKGNSYLEVTLKCGKSFLYATTASTVG